MKLGTWQQFEALLAVDGYGTTIFCCCILGQCRLPKKQHSTVSTLNEECGIPTI